MANHFQKDVDLEKLYTLGKTWVNLCRYRQWFQSFAETLRQRSTEPSSGESQHGLQPQKPVSVKIAVSAPAPERREPVALVMTAGLSANLRRCVHSFRVLTVEILNGRSESTHTLLERAGDELLEAVDAFSRALNSSTRTAQANVDSVPPEQSDTDLNRAVVQRFNRAHKLLSTSGLSNDIEIISIQLNIAISKMESYYQAAVERLRPLQPNSYAGAHFYLGEEIELLLGPEMASLVGFRLRNAGSPVNHVSPLSQELSRLQQLLTSATGHCAALANISVPEWYTSYAEFRSKVELIDRQIIDTLLRPTPSTCKDTVKQRALRLFGVTGAPNPDAGDEAEHICGQPFIFGGGPLNITGQQKTILSCLIAYPDRLLSYDDMADESKEIKIDYGKTDSDGLARFHSTMSKLRKNLTDQLGKPPTNAGKKGSWIISEKINGKTAYRLDIDAIEKAVLQQSSGAN